ncbi:MAG: adenylate/guanylate cyclase domain-containing protein [Melioribacteraceae bacterium]|nr:adenylate/guanylate cyclase domain-containing protein [Melioribacteraceae bacterium]
MSFSFDYTTRAKKFALRYPLLTDIGLQIIFWIIAFLLYFTLVNFIAKAVSSLFDTNTIVHISENILIALIGAVVFGILLGMIDFYVERRLRRRSFGLELLVKFSLYVITWFAVGVLTRNIGVALEAKFIEGTPLEYGQMFFRNMGTASSIYAVAMIMVISFIKQMNTKFGPGIILPMILGRYRHPREEERIFLFMDLKSSTSYAEKLGHLKYSEMIQNCFQDLNQVIPKYYAEIYQYVGDEVVITWLKSEGLDSLNCIRFFFAFQNKLKSGKLDYKEKYGLIPEFKAGLHLGEITVAEVGEIKREIAYHGDTINTAARIQKLCNPYNKKFLISEALKEHIASNHSFNLEFVDETVLEGKSQKVKIYSISE